VATGFEVNLVINTWQPEPIGPNSCPNRQGVEGYHLLLKIPHLEEVPFMELEEGSSAVIQNCKHEIDSLYSLSSLDLNEVKVRKSWDNFYQNLAPKSDNIDEYLASVKLNPDALRNPLGYRRAKGHIIWDSSAMVTRHSWSFNPHPNNRINPDFEYPAVLQAAMNSVSSMHMPRSNRPRLTAEQDDSLLQFFFQFDEKTTGYYDTMKTDQKQYKKKTLQDLVLRIIDYSGVRFGLSGSKADMVAKIQSWNKSFVCTIFRSPLPQQSMLIDSKLKLPILSEEDADLQVSSSRDSPEGKVVTRKDFQSLVKCFTARCFEALLDMFDYRDFRICTAYNEKYGNTEGFVPRKRSKFLTFDFMRALSNTQSIDDFDVASYFGNLDDDPIASYHRIYFLYEDESDKGDVSLIFLDMNSKIIEIVNVRWGSNVALANNDLQRMIFEKFKSLTAKLRINFEQDSWKIRLFPLQLYDPIEVDPNIGTGVYIITILYFLCIDCPIFFNREQIEIARVNFSLWILNKSLPI
jgi:hypothetical protein